MDGVRIKIGVTPVLHGCVYEPGARSVSPSVEAQSGFAGIQVVSFAGCMTKIQASTSCDIFIHIVKSRFDPEPLLPLPHVHFEILICLAEHDQHGYSIKREIAVRTGGRIQLGPGSLYGAINKLTDAGLIEESDQRPESHLDDERRRYYRLTTEGRAVLKAEAARLRTLVELAETRFAPVRPRYP